MSLLTVAVVAATLSLARWQQGRATEKAALQSAFEQQDTRAAAQALMPDLARFSRVNLTGAWLPQHQVLLDNQSHAGRPGYHALAVWRDAASGQAIVVDRGWQPWGAQRALALAPPLPAQTAIEGRLNLPPQRYKELAANTAEGHIIQNLDIAKLSARFGLPLSPYVLQQTSGAPDGLVRAWPAPDFKINTHRMYAGQWLCFAGLALVLWIIFSFKKVSHE